MKRKISEYSIGYKNKLEQFHHEDDKPSLIRFDGVIYFCKKDKFHPKGKPSTIYSNGTLRYWQDDKLFKFIY